MTAQAGDTSTTPTAARKAILRRRLRLQRRQLPLAERRQAERKATLHLLQLLLARRAQHIALYLSASSELSTTPLIACLRQTRCRLYAPVASPGGRMRFLPLDAQGRTRRDALGLPRPASTRGQRDPRRLDAVIVPLVGFDAQGHRLGAGGGYYDRHFAFRRLHSAPPLLIGLAFELQRVDTIPVDDWDLRLDAVVTERRVYRRISA